MAFKIESSLLDACALAILSRGDTYGYEITQQMKKAIMIDPPNLRRFIKSHSPSAMRDHRVKSCVRHTMNLIRVGTGDIIL